MQKAELESRVADMDAKLKELKSKSMALRAKYNERMGEMANALQLEKDRAHIFAGERLALKEFTDMPKGEYDSALEEINNRAEASKSKADQMDTEMKEEGQERIEEINAVVEQMKLAEGRKAVFERMLKRFTSPNHAGKSSPETPVLAM